MVSEQLLTDLATMVAEKSMTFDQLQEDRKNGGELYHHKRFVDSDELIRFIRTFSSLLKQEKELEKFTKPVEKFIFVEDGSVDSDELVEELSLSNPEIKVVIYRQGGRIPELVKLEKVQTK